MNMTLASCRGIGHGLGSVDRISSCWGETWTLDIAANAICYYPIEAPLLQRERGIRTDVIINHHYGIDRSDIIVPGKYAGDWGSCHKDWLLQ